MKGVDDLLHDDPLYNPPVWLRDDWFWELIQINPRHILIIHISPQLINTSDYYY